MTLKGGPRRRAGEFRHGGAGRSLSACQLLRAQVLVGAFSPGEADSVPVSRRTRSPTAAPTHSLCWTGLMPLLALFVVVGADEPAAMARMSTIMMDSWVSILLSPLGLRRCLNYGGVSVPTG